MRREGKRSYGEVGSDGSSKAGGGKLDTGSIFFRRVGSASDSDSPGGFRARENYSSETVPTVVKEVKRPTTWDEGVTAKRNEYAKMRFPKYMVVHREEKENGAEGRVIAGLLEPYPGQVLDRMVANETKDFGVQRFCTGTRKKCQEVLYYKRLLCEDKVVEYLALKKLEPTGAEMLRWKAVNRKVTRYSVAK